MQAEYSFDDKELKDFYTSLVKRFGKVQKKDKEFIGAISSFVFQDVIDHFEKEMGSDGPWADWSDSYKASIAKRTFFRRIAGKTIPFQYDEVEDPPDAPRAPGMKLQDTGRLRNSFGPSDYKVAADGVVWFNNAKADGFPYAFAHNEGGDKLPKRDFMWLSDKALEKISDATLDYMLEEKENK